MATPSTETRPASRRNTTAEDLIEAAERLVPVLRERAVVTDSERRISDEVYRLLEDEGFFHILKPKRYGGLELGDDVHAAVTMTLARGCASTAWVFSILSADNCLLFTFPQSVQDEIWGDDSFATLAGNTNLNTKATAEPVDDGYLLSGSWGFCSGSDFSRWLVFIVPAGEQSEPHIFLVPNERAATVDDWFPSGMRGTGSRTKVLDSVFVPARHVIPFSAVGPGWIAARELYPDFELLHGPFPSYGKFEFAGVAVGAAIGAVEHFASTVGSSTRVANLFGGEYTLSEQEYVATEFAQASGDVLLAKTLVQAQSGDVTAHAASRTPVTDLEQATWNRNYALVTRVALRAVQQLSALVGSKVGNPSHPIALAERDIRMMSHHVTLNWRQAAVQYLAAEAAAHRGEV